MTKILEIENLKTIAADDKSKEILKGLNLVINEGEIHVIMGPNGSGKSTLAFTCFNSPKYIKTSGRIKLCGEDITNEKTNIIAQKGLYMSFQNPETIPGVSVANLIKTSKKSITNEKESISTFYSNINNKLESLKLNKEFALRDFNVGFSGGEKKKNEMLQLLMLNPKLAILDETDSGLDVDAIKTVSETLNLYKNEKNAILIITHSTKILEKFDKYKVHILIDGKIIDSCDKTLAMEIDEKGYSKYFDDENKCK